MATEHSNGTFSYTPQMIASVFVDQYYHVLHRWPKELHKFYHESSFLSRPDADGTMTTVSTLQGIDELILSTNYSNYYIKIKSVDSQPSYNNGVIIVVTGSMTSASTCREFIQSFFLAPQDFIGGYFVLNDLFRFLDKNLTGPVNEQKCNGMCDVPFASTDSESGIYAEPKAEVPKPTENGGLLGEGNVSVDPPVQTHITVSTSTLPGHEDAKPISDYTHCNAKQEEIKSIHANLHIHKKLVEAEQINANPPIQAKQEENKLVLANSPDHMKLVEVEQINANPIIQGESEKIKPILANSPGHTKLVEAKQINANPPVQAKQAETKHKDAGLPVLVLQVGLEQIDINPIALAEQEEKEPVTNLPAESINGHISLSHETVSFDVQVDDAPKMTYASIVKVTNNSPSLAPAKAASMTTKVTPNTEIGVTEESASGTPKSVHHLTTSSATASPTGQNASENTLADVPGHSVHLKFLPPNIDARQVEEEFKKFGVIKPGGVQVKFHQFDDFCFGFVEFETIESMQTAIEASPVSIWGHRVVVEEKRSQTRVVNGIVVARGDNGNYKGAPRGNYQYDNSHEHGGFRNTGNFRNTYYDRHGDSRNRGDHRVRGSYRLRDESARDSQAPRRHSDGAHQKRGGFGFQQRRAKSFA